MQLIKIIAVVTLATNTVTAAPRNQNGANWKRWWWGSDEGDDSWDHQRHRSHWSTDDGNGGDEPYPELTSCSSTMTSPSTMFSSFTTEPSSSNHHTIFSSCAVPSPSTIFVTVGATTTCTHYLTYPSYPPSYSISSSSSSTLTSAFFTYSTSMTYSLSTHHRTNQTSALYPNTTATFLPLNTSPNNKTRTQHSNPQEFTSIAISSSMIFIPAPSPVPPSASITGSPILFPTTTLIATTTISGTRVPTGTPLSHALLCNVHGFPVGDFFLAQLVESRAGVEITLYSCYSFCAGIFGIDMGCQSFDFYPEPGTGAPRCDLYSGSVEQSLDVIIPQVPNTWYDVGCVVPMS